jgi:hypothetical protein
VSEKGRGAFTSVGKDNGKSWYAFVKNTPVDGSSPEKGFNYEAVHLGVLSIEQRLFDLGYDVKVDGLFGPRVKLAVRDFQEKRGLPVSGEIGFTTGPELWRDYIKTVGASYKYPAQYVWGTMRQESGGDPGAVGYDTPGDRGIFQFNTLAHEVTYEEAHNFEWATETAFTRFQKAWNKYAGKGPDLRLNCTILQHKSPYSADVWFETGESPGPISDDYVSRVKAFALTF